MSEFIFVGDMPKFEAGFTPKNLKILMTERNLSVKSLAEKMGLNVQTVSNWRNGKSTMPHEQWIAFLELKND